eukprot:8388730-Prorocentrum_lima.AAC.1
MGQASVATQQFARDVLDLAGLLAYVITDEIRRYDEGDCALAIHYPLHTDRGDITADTSNISSRS